MKGHVFNVGLEDANLSKVELCQEIQKVVPNFVYLEAPIGEDPDKRDYIVSNKKILATGYQPDWTLQRGIEELVKGYTILRSGFHSNT
jgi:nucleoside-diphosphate-sugar epimerase